MSKKMFRIIGMILFFVVPFLIGLVIGMGIKSKSNNQLCQNNKNEGRVIIDDKELIDKLFKVVNNDKLERVIYHYRANGVNLINITNDEKLYLAGMDTYYKATGKWVSLDTLKDNLIDLYATDFNVKAENYNYHDISNIKYDNGDYTASGNVASYTDNSFYIDLYNTLRLEKEDNNYYLIVSGIYHQKLKNTENYSNDKGFVFNEAISKNTTVSDLYKTNEEQFMKYTFLFIKDNNKYILKELIIDN